MNNTTKALVKLIFDDVNDNEIVKYLNDNFFKQDGNNKATIVAKLKNEKNLDGRILDGRNVLILAFFYNKTQTALKLLESKYCNPGKTALIWACYNGKSEIAMAIFKHYDNFVRGKYDFGQQKDLYGYDALRYTCEKPLMDDVSIELINRGCKVDEYVLEKLVNQPNREKLIVFILKNFGIKNFGIKRDIILNEATIAWREKMCKTLSIDNQTETQCLTPMAKPSIPVVEAVRQPFLDRLLNMVPQRIREENAIYRDQVINVPSENVDVPHGAHLERNYFKRFRNYFNPPDVQNIDDTEQLANARFVEDPTYQVNPIEYVHQSQNIDDIPLTREQLVDDAQIVAHDGVGENTESEVVVPRKPSRRFGRIFRRGPHVTSLAPPTSDSSTENRLGGSRRKKLKKKYNKTLKKKYNKTLKKRRNQKFHK